ncbi:pancreatic lipase-related protein 2-like [Limulus polyphemus]|uniref:Pancreatic lipase-related protein 2-like n=1 Tax=Limulus polyphemus TaxID=6850 RepID=A0ABM1BCY5_LIMPO|nr:pancreatic lipase-related protein 2-like [Limulus polyphemus]
MMFLAEWHGFVFFLQLVSLVAVLTRGSTSVYSSSKILERIKREEKCYDDLGCFSNGGNFYDPIKRPIDVLPQSRDVINTRFILYTSKDKNNYEILDPTDKNSISNSGIIPSANTKILIHGVTLRFSSERWLKKMKDEYLKQGDYNIILVDWSKGSWFPYYQAVANARLVGAEIAQLISRLQEVKGISLDSVHLIGHSLGAQVAGYAGERLNKVRRITGLDPAGPYFTGTPENIRLDRSDAEFVDVIHTDSSKILLYGLSTTEVVGHVDFFPNKGNEQPGCLSGPLKTLFSDGVEQGVRRLLGCDHLRAIDYYLEALRNKKCTPVGIACERWDDFIRGKCADCGEDNSKCVKLGPQAEEYLKYKDDNKSQKLFLKTASNEPFCLFHYYVEVNIAKPANSTSQRGLLHVTIKGSDDNLKMRLSDRNGSLKPGKKLKYLVTSRRNVGSINSLQAHWTKRSVSILDPEFWHSRRSNARNELFLRSIKVNPLNGVSRQGRQLKYSEFCGNPTQAIKPKEEVTLSLCDSDQ